MTAMMNSPLQDRAAFLTRRQFFSKSVPGDSAGRLLEDDNRDIRFP